MTVEIKVQSIRGDVTLTVTYPDCTSVEEGIQKFINYYVQAREVPPTEQGHLPPHYRTNR